MKIAWQPGIPMRWKRERSGIHTLQQVWCKWVLGDEEWVQTKEYRWEDVPVDIDDATYWSKEE